MRLKEFNLSGRLAVSMFAATVLVALASAELLIHYSLGNTMAVDAVKAKYAGNLLVSAMWGSMYEHVTEDESVAIVESWIADGATEEGYTEGVAEVMAEDCTNCHSRTSTMTEAIPSMPLTSYEDVKTLTVRGLPRGKLLGQVHTHLFALGVILLLLSLLLATSDIGRGWAIVLTVMGFVGLWLDIGGWVLGTLGEWSVWMIMGGGGLLAVALAAMSVLVLLDCWVRVPLLSRS